MMTVSKKRKERVFHSFDEVERTYFPKAYAERLEKEKMESMTPEQQSKYLGKKWADEIFAAIRKSLA